jgi:thymidylate kinase
LVHRHDGQRFAEILDRLGFRHAVAPGGREHPGVSHHYALDVPSGRFVHVHAHVSLVLGDDTTKNYRLPIEAAYLASCSHDRLFPVPAPEFELAVFVLRMVLKHATGDALAFGKGALGGSERRELDWLIARADPGRTLEVVRAQLPGVGVELWQACLAASMGRVRLPQRLATGRRLARALRPHGRRSWPHDLILRVVRRLTWGSRAYLLRLPARKRLARGGATIAVVGGDGSGKSTVVAGTVAWLGGPLRVRRLHLGKPRPSLLTLAVKGPMYLARSAGLLDSAWASVDPRTAGPEDFPGNAWALWHLFTARDRLRDYRLARHEADTGGIVVSDRWPLREIALMDGPRTTWVLHTPDRFSRLTCRIARAEERVYAQIAPPDVLVVLRIDPEVAVARRTDEESTYVRARNTEVRDVDWSRTHAVVVDASLPAEAVLDAVRRTIWERL